MVDMQRIDGDHSDAFAPRVYMIRVSRLAMKNNNYLVVDPATRLAVVVDPAWEMNKIQPALAAAGATLCGILLTHAHPDHTDLAEPLAKVHDCPIWMSRQEIISSGYDARHLVPIDETPWMVGRMRIEPLLTPGHTPGCVCYRIGRNLFTGDVLFAEGCGICADVDAAHAMYASLQRLKSCLDPHTRIFPGHTYLRPPGQRFSDVLANNLYLHFRDREAFAAYRLRKGQSTRMLMNFR